MTTVNADDLATFDHKDWNDVSHTQYSTINFAGDSKHSDPIVPLGASIGSLLRLVSDKLSIGLSSTATYATTVGRDGASSTLSSAKRDFSDPSPFEDGLEPVFWQTSDAFNYIRPLRDDSDVNGPEYLQTLDGGHLDLTVHTSGSALTPTVTPASQTVGAKTPASFTASTDDPDSTEVLTYTWTFGDGSVSEPQGAQTSHQYTSAGTYYAYVDVAGSNGSSGESQTVMVTIKASASSTPPPTKTHSPTPTGTSHGNGSKSNPNHGPTGGSGHHGGGAPQTSTANNSTAGRSPSATPSATPASPSPPSSTPASLPVLTSGSVLNTETALPSSGAPVGAATSTAASLSRSAAAGGTATDQIAGYLIAGPAGVALRSPSASKAEHPPLTAPAARNAATRRQIALWGFYILGILALLALGIRAEVRRPVRPTDRLH